VLQAGRVEVLRAWWATSPIWQIGPADVLDILIVTVFAYVTIAFLRRTRAGFAAFGLLLLGALYVVARALGLALTTWILGAFSAALLVIVVVIFQEELRQLFEEVATWSMRRTGQAVPAGRDGTDLLVSTLFDLARARVGALVVLPGRQLIDRHVRGGIRLDGELSAPLLLSLFDPHSPGHDGAVVLRNGRVERFAVHLPLSRSEAQPPGSGTRHSAALGLAERTDALCLAVSEERGVVSVAEEGRIERIDDPQRVLARVERHLRPDGALPPSERPGRRRLRAVADGLRRNWIEKAAVLVVVTGLWTIFAAGERPIEATFTVPVTVENVPAALEIDSVDPDEVQVTLTGMRRAFYFFDGAALVVRIDAAGSSRGQRRLAVDARNVIVPEASLAVLRVEPTRVRLTLQSAPST
jgi:diadenylate cyclase